MQVKIRPAWMLEERAAEAVWRLRAGPPDVRRAEESEVEATEYAGSRYCGRVRGEEHVFTRHDLDDDGREE